MWLPKDERWVLEGWYHVIGEPNKESPGYWKGDLAERLEKPKSWKAVATYLAGGQGANDKELTKEAVLRLLPLMGRLEKAHKVLEERGMIGQKPHESREVDVIFVTLTVKGYDLGRKYSGWWDRSGLWFREYKDHWLVMLLAAVVGGVLGGVVLPLVLDMIR